MIRAQAGLEYAAVVAFALVLMVPAAFYLYQSALIQSSVSQTELAAVRLVSAADAVKANAPGARTTVEIYLPPGLTDARVGGREVLFRLSGFGGSPVDAYRVAVSNLSSSTLPTAEGVYVITVVHENGGNVSITAA